MGDRSKIEWTDASWSPIRAMIATPDGPRIGWHCEHVSDGCRNCYSESMNRRLGTGEDFKPGNLRHKNNNGDDRGDVSVFLDDKMLTQPFRWKKPRAIFVCSMTDLFARFVPDAWIDRVFAVMALAPQHKFLVLTKRAKRMRQYMTDAGAYARILIAAAPLRSDRPELMSIPISDPRDAAFWPQLWLGVSAERQQEADERIPELLATPAAGRFVSAEPLLSEINFRRMTLSHPQWDGLWLDALTGAHEGIVASPPYKPGYEPAPSLPPRLPGLDGIIIGGESGFGARPMQVAWVRSIIEQRSIVGTACFVKQLGADPVWEDDAFLNLKDRKGGDPAEWPEDLRVQQLPWRSAK